ncbi:MAG: PAS domain-containing sensor histidine kinase [Tissierellaceae bacterium]|nr:PAS domain-containing sensor histidine kinase [Tissierellaceae bacterium]
MDISKNDMTSLIDFFEINSDAFIIVNQKLVISYANLPVENYLGVTRDQIIGRRLQDVFKNSQNPLDVKKLYKVLNKRETQHWEAFSNLDGWRMDINIYPINNGELVIKITKIKQMEDFLSESEEKYQNLLNSIDQGLAIVEVIFDKESTPVDFKYEEFNQAFEKLAGSQINNVLDKTAKDLQLNLESFWFQVYENVALTGQPKRFVYEEKKINKWFDVYVFKIYFEGNKVGVLFNDVTERVLHNHKLEELIKIQDELYVNVSHELKTPLNVIFSANQLMDVYLRNDSVENNKDDLIDSNNIIKQNCYRLTKLINNAVDLSKINSGLLMLNLVNINIVDFIENIVQLVSEYLKTKDLKIIFDTNVEEKIFACDPDKIERVVLNLISNAIKFSNPNSEILVRVQGKDDKVEISVKDTGIGIEKQNLECIFNKFYQEDKSLSRSAEGSGIGLSLTKSLVELHGGNVNVKSIVNEGSIFMVELPIRTIESQKPRVQTNFYNNRVEAIRIEFSDIYSI